MPIYSELLILSSKEEVDVDAPADPVARGDREGRGEEADEQLGELRRLRSLVGNPRTAERRPGSAAGRLADQLAYDTALIRYCRRVGIDCSAADFGRPEAERSHLEELLAGRGIELRSRPAADPEGQDPAAGDPGHGG